MSYQRFLLFDGGPSEFVTVRILREIERTSPGFLERTDVFSGTSDGGFTTLYLSHALQQGKNGLEALEGCVAFLDELAGAFKVGPGNLLRLATGLRSLYSGEKLREVLSQHFGDARLGELKRPVWLTALDVSDGTPVRIRSEAYQELRLVDAASASAAFPLLFPLYSYWGYDFRQSGTLVADGGFVDNSTLLTTLTHQLVDAGPEPLSKVESLARMLVLSVGSRQARTFWNPCPPRYPKTRYEYGWIWWLYTGLRNALMLLDAGAAKEYSFMLALLGEQSHRFEHRLSETKLMFLSMLSPARLISEAEGVARQEWGSAGVAALRAWIAKRWMA